MLRNKFGYGLALLGLAFLGRQESLAAAGYFVFSSPSSRFVVDEGRFKSASEGRIMGWDQLSITKPGPGSNVYANTWTLTMGTGYLSKTNGTLPLDLLYSTTYGMLSHGIRISALEYDNAHNKQNITSLFDKVSDLGIAVVPAAILSSTYELTGNYDIGASNPVTVHSDLTWQGNGRTIRFARKAVGDRRAWRGSDGVIEVATGKTLTFTDVVLDDYDDDQILLHRGAKVVFGDNTVIKLADRTAMKRNWTTNGSVLINGSGCGLDLDGYQIAVTSGTLILQNVSLEGVDEGSISCATSDSRVAMSNTNLLLTGDFDFSTGGMIVNDKVTIGGQGTFGYATDQELQIRPFGTLALDTGSLFFYKPTVANRDLIVMENETSTLQLNGCTLLSTTTGMRLTKGRLVIDSNNDIDNTGATSLSEAVAFGNGTAADDLAVEMMPGASLHVVGGILDYENAA